MPLYEYEICRAGSGEILQTIQLPLPVEERDALVLRRKALPRSIAIAGSTTAGGWQASQVLEAYRRIEGRMGSTAEFRRRIGHSPEAVKKAWGITGHH